MKIRLKAGVVAHVLRRLNQESCLKSKASLDCGPWSEFKASLDITRPCHKPTAEALSRLVYHKTITGNKYAVITWERAVIVRNRKLGTVLMS